MSGCNFIIAFPIADCIEPELLERQRAGEFCAGELDDIRVVGEIVQILPDELFVQFAANRICHVIKLIGHHNPLPDLKRRLVKTGVVDVVRRAPRAIHPVRAIFEKVVLEIIFVEQHQAALRRRFPRTFPAATNTTD